MATWRAVPDWEGYYEVSDEGQVRSLDRIIETTHGNVRHVKGQMLRAYVDNQGYKRVAPSRRGSKKWVYVHTLVAAAFLGPRPQGMEIRHLDGDPVNNRLLNLAYGTPSENRHDSVRHGRHNMASRKACPRGHTYSATNTYIHPVTGGRVCRVCRRAQQAKYWARRKAARLPAPSPSSGLLAG